MMFAHFLEQLDNSGYFENVLDCEIVMIYKQCLNIAVNDRIMLLALDDLNAFSIYIYMMYIMTVCVFEMRKFD